MPGWNLICSEGSWEYVDSFTWDVRAILLPKRLRTRRVDPGVCSVSRILLLRWGFDSAYPLPSRTIRTARGSIRGQVQASCVCDSDAVYPSSP